MNLDEAVEMLEVDKQEIIDFLITESIIDKDQKPTATAVAGNFIKEDGALSRRGMTLIINKFA